MISAASASSALHLVRRRLEEQLVVHLEQHAAPEAARRERARHPHHRDLDQSAAVPWIGAFVAMRSAKPRRFGLPLRSSGR